MSDWLTVWVKRNGRWTDSLTEQLMIFQWGEYKLKRIHKRYSPLPCVFVFSYPFFVFRFLVWEEEAVSTLCCFSSRGWLRIHTSEWQRQGVCNSTTAYYTDFLYGKEDCSSLPGSLLSQKAYLISSSQWNFDQEGSSAALRKYRVLVDVDCLNPHKVQKL